MPRACIAMPADADGLSECDRLGNAVPCDRNAMPRYGHQLSANRHQVSGSRYQVPNYGNAMPSDADALSGGRDDVPAEGHRLSVCDHSDPLPRGSHGVSADSDAMPGGRHVLPRNGHEMSNAHHEVSRDANTLPRGADDVSASFSGRRVLPAADNRQRIGRDDSFRTTRVAGDKCKFKFAAGRLHG